MRYPNTFKGILEEIKKNPRKCDKCGCTETPKNIILKYDNGQMLCDDCAIETFADDINLDNIGDFYD